MIKKIILALLLTLSISACATNKNLDVGIAKPIQIPRPPENLLIKAEKLPPITDSSFGGIMLDAADTDIKYNDVSIRFNQLIDFTLCIQESINEKKDLNKCLK